MVKQSQSKRKLEKEGLSQEDHCANLESKAQSESKLSKDVKTKTQKGLHSEKGSRKKSKLT